jgi:CheY-like chemotaxis protein
MDIMMPEMDGYETMREIRKNAAYRTLPILALTAKAMKGDRDKCLQAGASDYIAKPVNTDQLLSLLRVWLYRYWRTNRSRSSSSMTRRGTSMHWK